MIRPATMLYASAVVLVGYAMFQVKYEVQQQEETLARLDRQIAQSHEAARVLNAEWSFLTQPQRLSTLAKRYLNLVPIGAPLLGSLAALPARSPAPPAAQLATLKPADAR